MKLRYADVAATLALVIALGGVSWAAVTLPRNSVGTKQIKSSAVTSKDVRNGTLRKRDLRRGVLTPPPLAAGAVGPEHVRDDSLTGLDVDESTLSGLVAGDRRIVSSTREIEAGTTPEIDLPGLGRLTLRCSQDGNQFEPATYNDTGQPHDWITRWTYERYPPHPNPDPEESPGGMIAFDRWDGKNGPLMPGGIAAGSGDMENTVWSETRIAGPAGVYDIDIVGTVHALSGRVGCKAHVRLELPA